MEALGPACLRRGSSIFLTRTMSFSATNVHVEPAIAPVATREIRAPGPDPDAESLRIAYLELMKLTLCDLAGADTMSVTWTGGGRVFSRTLSGRALKLRAAGADWPVNGLTTIGLKRLDDLQSCVESAVREGIDGDMIETGAWRGGASILIRATLDSLGSDERTVWVADSFQGFPDPSAERFPDDPDLGDLNRVDVLSAPLEEVRGYFARFGCQRGVRFVPGSFEETMPGLRGRRWSVVRLDSDTYEATWLTLDVLYPGLEPGGYLIVDDYSYVDACTRAVDDFRRERGIAEPIEQVDWTGARWRKETESAISAEDASKTRPDLRQIAARTIPRDGNAGVPTWREVELEDELEEARTRLAAAEVELQLLWASRFRRWTAWPRRGASRST